MRWEIGGKKEKKGGLGRFSRDLLVVGLGFEFYVGYTHISLGVRIVRDGFGRSLGRLVCLA